MGLGKLWRWENKGGYSTLLALLLIAMAAAHAAAPTEPAYTSAVLTLPGSTARALYLSPAHPRAVLLMLIGGTGQLGLTADGHLAHRANVLVRTRRDWLARGYAVLLPDAPDRHSLRGQRSSSAYLAYLNRWLDRIAGQTAAPVILLGTSQGSIAAVNGAAHLAARLHGVVLSEPVTVPGGSHETVFDAGLQQVALPTLIVTNHDDQCPVTPASGAAQMMARMPLAPTRLAYVDGGEGSSAHCDSLSAHGYRGQEAAFVQHVATWIQQLH